MRKFDQKREEIKKAGLKSFAAYGYYKTTLEDIANMLGLKKNSLYYYFENKDALFIEIIEDTIAAHMEQTKNIIQQKVPATEKLKLVTQFLTDFIRKQSLEYTITISSFLEISKVMRNSFPDFQQSQGSCYKSILDEGMANNEFKKIDAVQLSKDLSSIIPAIFSQHYINSDTRFVSEIDFDSITEEIDRLMSYIIDGIKSN